MKLRHPSLIKAAGFGLAGVLAAWLGTLRYRLFERVKGVAPWTPGLNETFIYTFWHETLLHKLVAIGAPLSFILMFWSFLHGREFCVRVGACLCGRASGVCLLSSPLQSLSVRPAGWRQYPHLSVCR